MTPRCCVCERSGRPLEQRGPNLLCAACIAEQVRVMARDHAWKASGFWAPPSVEESVARVRALVGEQGEG